MFIVVECDQCDARYRVPEALAGRSGRCKRCGNLLTVPYPPPPGAEPPMAGLADEPRLAEIIEAIERGEYQAVAGTARDYLARHTGDPATLVVEARLARCLEAWRELDELERLIEERRTEQAHALAGALSVPQREAPLLKRLGALKARMAAWEGRPEAEARSQESEDRSQKPGARSQKTEDRRPESEDRSQQAEVRSQEPADSHHQAEGERERVEEENEGGDEHGRDGEASAGWFVVIPGTDRKQGPFTTDEIRTGLLHGSFKPWHLAWREGMTEWPEIGDIAELAAGPSAKGDPESAGDELAGRGMGGVKLGRSLLRRHPRSFVAVILLLAVVLVWRSGAAELCAGLLDPKRGYVEAVMQAILEKDLAAVQAMADPRNYKKVVRNAGNYSKYVKRFEEIERVRDYAGFKTENGENVAGRAYRVGVTKKLDGQRVHRTIHVVVAEDSDRILVVGDTL